MQAAVVTTYFPSIKFGQFYFARYSKSRKKTRRAKQLKEESIIEWTGLEFGLSQKAMEICLFVVVLRPRDI